MPLTPKQALALKRGDRLRFNTEAVYGVLSVTPQRTGVYLTLRRESDGYETHATETDLDVAVKVETVVSTAKKTTAAKQ